MQRGGMSSKRSWKVSNGRRFEGRCAFRNRTNAIRRLAGGTSEEGFEEYVLRLQRDICLEAELLDGSEKRFGMDRWERNETDPKEGYGISRVLEGGNLIEKGAANVSVIRGKLTPVRAKTMSSRGRAVNPQGGDPYSAVAMSLVFHAQSPHVPTLRADVRMFQVGDHTWYGGGCDLTPSYIVEEDITRFHAFWKEVCDRHHSDYYPKYKQWCDEYFYLPSRKEHRGTGGIFFDDLELSPVGQEAESFVRDVGENIINSWRDIAIRWKDISFSETEREWQLLRRGRYVEFNLLYDRGVKFGLEGGRVESIMVSAPPLVRWGYDVHPLPGTEEAKMMDVLQNPKHWV